MLEWRRREVEGGDAQSRRNDHCVCTRRLLHASLWAHLIVARFLAALIALLHRRTVNALLLRSCESIAAAHSRSSALLCCPQFLMTAISFRITRLVCLRLIAAVYLCAFLSAYVQWRGLLGCDGLEPVSSLLYQNTRDVERLTTGAFWARPTLVWLHAHPWIGLDVDTWCELLCLAGASISAALVLLGCDWAPAFALLLILYSSLQSVGQTFLSFQWDILLIETGAIAVLLGSWARPSFSISPFSACDRRTRERRARAIARHPNDPAAAADEADESAPPHSLQELASTLLPSTSADEYSLPLFLFRFLLFRLMLASGLVKILSRCPTWNTLTAMEYHYATQCLPTPLAWFAHQLPPAVQQLTTAGSIFVETAATLLILVPVSIPALSYLRQASIFLQTALQIAIILTGNYTFFNILTITLVTAAAVTDGEWERVGRALRPWRWGERCAAGMGSKQTVAPDTSTADGTQVLLAATPAVCRSSPALRRAEQVHRTLYSACLFVLRIHVVGCLFFLFQRMYSLDWSGAEEFHRGWSAAPPLSPLLRSSVKDLPYLLLRWIYPLGSLFSITPLFTPEDTEQLVENWLPWLIQGCVAIAALNAVWSVGCVLARIVSAWRHRSRPFIALLMHSLSSLFHLSFLLPLCCALFLSSLVPFTHSLSPSLLHRLPFSTELIGIYQHVNLAGSLHLSNSYGLFRQMTGVGPDQLIEEPSSQRPPGDASAAASLPPRKTLVTTVHRPELLLEGSFSPLMRGASPDTREWHLIDFPHKPSNFSRAPTWIAPHQPRLDWQFWFASLGEQPPQWLVTLIAKLLQPPASANGGKGPQQPSTENVWALLSPSGHFNASHPPKQLRVRKALLDFTRMDGCDAGRNNKNKDKATSKRSRNDGLSIPSDWWVSSGPERMFLHPIDAATLAPHLPRGSGDACASMHGVTKMRREAWNTATAKKPTKRSFFFPSPTRIQPWRLQFWLVWVERLVPLPSTYGPFAAQLTSIVQEARLQWNQFIESVASLLRSDASWTELALSLASSRAAQFLTSLAVIFGLAHALRPKHKPAVRSPSRVVFMCGVAGSGKSTFARRLEKEEGFVRLSIDELAWEAGHRTQPLSDDVKRSMEAQLRSQLMQHISEGRNVVLDLSFWSRHMRAEYLALLAPLGVVPSLVWLDTPRSIVLRRVAQRKGNGAANEVVVSQETAKRYLDAFEKPTEAEGFQSIRRVEHSSG